MENLYGKRTATFLRGAIMKERKDQFIKWEKNKEEYKRNKNQEIELTEQKMFLNSFAFAKSFL